MEVQLKELIDKIKTEGVGEAEEKARQITEEAERRASEMLARAHEEAERTAAGARAEAARFEEAGRESIRQAGRDLTLNLKSSITRLFETIVARETKAALTQDALEKIITNLIRAWQKKGVDNIQVLLSPADFKKIEKGFLEKLSDEMKRGVEFKPVAEIQAGFRIGEKKGEVYYDFTDRGIAEHLIEYLNPKLAECMNPSEVSAKGESGE